MDGGLKTSMGFQNEKGRTMPVGKSEFKQWMVDLRNDFHQHPELSTHEKRTTKQICKVLNTLNVQVRTFDDITGVVGVLKGNNQRSPKNRTLALRADIDALPMQEAGEKTYKSINSGVMHSCGHDANTAILLGVAKKISDSDLLNKIDGTIKFIFQPAEEKLGGAKAMIKRGVLENPPVDQIIAGHMDPNLPVGTVGVFTRIGHAASDPFELVIKGKGTHGARPHEGINPISAGGFFVSSLESIIPRHIDPAQSAVISIGTFHAGEAGNVIPDQAVIKGSVRTHDKSVRNRIFSAMKNLIRGLDDMFGTRCELVFRPGAPLGINDKEVCKSLYTASVEVLGRENVRILPFIMGSDDFYYFAQKCPGAMMRFGCASGEKPAGHPLHSPLFDIHEDVLEIGADVLVKAVENFFNQPLHPYTRGLMACIPVPGKTKPGEKLGAIPGIVPTPIGALWGCSFRNRCHLAGPDCAAEDLELKKLPDQRSFRCVRPRVDGTGKITANAGEMI